MAIIDRVTDYAKDVVSGKIIAGETQKQACARHLNDLKRQGADEFLFFWDVEKANDMLDFAENLVVGEGTPQPLILEPFQAFCFGNWNGWVNEQGYRRFRTSYIQIAKQNGKSLMNGVPILYYGNFYGYMYPQIYTAATLEKQAKIVWKEAAKFILSDKELCGTKYEEGLFKIKEYISTIVCNLTGGEIKALGKDTQIDGFRPFFGSVDEYHLHPTNAIYKMLTGGMIDLDEGLISVITTAGENLNAPCKTLYDYCKSILAGVIKDETQFVYIAELDEGDDPWDEEVWPKANPRWSEKRKKNLRADALKAKNMGGEDERYFLIKLLNKWLEFVKNGYMNLKHWAKCASDKKLEDFRGMACYCGLDLSAGGDLTSLSLVFPYEADGRRKYYVYSHSFIPAKRVTEHIKEDKAPYDMWIKKGLLTATETNDGVKTDYKYILTHLEKLVKKYDLDLKMICYDPANASAFLGDLNELGYMTLEVKQSALSLNDATEDFRLECEAGNVEYDVENELLTWSVTNAKVVKNAYGSIKIDKANRSERIDPVDATIDAWKMAMRSEEVFDLQKSVDEYLEETEWEEGDE